ncbi:hypothetical protein GOBAR_AA35314 [Gossypium barbadense]|uniref:Uncharacterized protein n=1 Tax=Gossypium barbadense TaxID=3634 RepID=A0A2P5W2P8_GOSBA|nr:hypothetical protein GOBAR_AA35314 [Gossypium barbadense]
MKPSIWFSLPSPYVDSGANPSLLTATTDLKIVGDAGTACNTKDSSDESTSLSHEINEYMDVMLDMRKKCMTNTWAANVVLSNEEEEDSAILEQHWIKMTDHTRPSTIVVSYYELTFCFSWKLTYCCPSGAPVKFVTIGGNISELFPWSEHVSMKEFLYSPKDVTNHLKISLPEAAKEHMCSAGSFNGVKKSSL